MYFSWSPLTLVNHGQKRNHSIWNLYCGKKNNHSSILRNSIWLGGLVYQFGLENKNVYASFHNFIKECLDFFLSTFDLFCYLLRFSIYYLQLIYRCTDVHQIIYNCNCSFKHNIFIFISHFSIKSTKWGSKFIHNRRKFRFQVIIPFIE